MSKVRKGKRVAAAAMAVALSVATVTTSVLPNTAVHVHAEESDRTWTKLADSSVGGVYYREDQYGNIECVTDKTLEYSSYDETVSKLSEITRRIIQEDKYARYSFNFPIKIKTDEKNEKLESNQINKDLENEVYKETGDPKGGHTMAAMGGGLIYLDVTYSETDNAYVGKVWGGGGYGEMRERYRQTVEKLDAVIKSLNLNGKSDYDKCKSIMWWIRNNVKYDWYYEGTKYPHDLTGAVLDGYAVCDGFAGVFYYMANAVGIQALYEDGTDDGEGHAWNLVQIDGMYYYIDPTAARLNFTDGELDSEILWGSNNIYKKTRVPYTDAIEKTYKNISEDDYSKEHSVCKGNHDLWESGHNGATCESPATTVYSCKNKGCLYKKYVETAPALGHTWDNGKVTQEQSCENSEITTYTCTNSLCERKKQVETKPALGHTWDDGKVTKEASCSETGVKTYACSTCGNTKTEEIPKTKHDYEEHVVTPATCTSKGVSYYVCKNCGLTTSRRPTPATGHIHTEVRNKKDATYKEDGYTGDTYCKDCGKKLETGTVIPKLVEKEHDYGEWILDQAPTCKKYGARHRICKNCGDRKVDVLDKVDHTWDDGEITKEATETQEGIKTYTCKKCGETKTEAIPAKSHHWDQGTITKKATCTENGEKTYHCTDADCDQTYVEVIPATGHQHTELRDKKTATCKEDGYSGDTYCTDCGRLISKGAAIKATGHDWSDGKVTEVATCKKEGTKTYTCKNCGEPKTESIPKKDHTWSEGKVTKEATCAEDGLKVYTCKDCDETKEEVIKATGHQHTEVRNAKRATCKEEGYSGDTYCKDCGKLIKKGSVTEKLDHNWQRTKDEKATCGKDGFTTYTCSSCGKAKTETIPATGHSFCPWETISQATVFAPAKQTRHCNLCGKTENRTYGSRLKATIKANATSLKLKRKQSTKKFMVSGLSKGDFVKSWSSSNKKIITVSGSKKGTCTIKARNKTGKAKLTITLASGLKKTINVTVQKNAVACTSIKNVPKKLTLNRKKTYQLKPVINPITCTYKAKYKTSNKKIVKVSSKGKITAVKKGKAKIIITAGKKKFVCTVTIK